VVDRYCGIDGVAVVLELSRCCYGRNTAKGWDHGSATVPEIPHPAVWKSEVLDQPVLRRMTQDETNNKIDKNLPVTYSVGSAANTSRCRLPRYDILCRSAMGR
jgi:hypothetical protein